MLLLNTFNKGFNKKYNVLTEARMTAEEKILKRRIINKLKEQKKDEIVQCIESANVKLTSNSNTRGYYSEANNSFIFNKDLSLIQIIDDLVNSFPKTLKTKESHDNSVGLVEEKEELNESSIEDKPIQNWSKADWEKYANLVL